MTKSKRNKSQIIIGSFLIMFGLILGLGKYFYNFALNKVDEIKVETFLENKQPSGNVINSKNHISYKTSKNNYYAIIEIPSISLKKGLINKESKYNNVNKNIETLKNSDTPDVVGGSVLLASHSGNSRVSYFKNLYRVNIGDSINIYYNNYKYEYKITDIYNQEKTGTITYQYKNTTMIVLTTCNQQQKGKQIIVIGTLNNKTNY